MKLKPIENDMIVHCKTEDEAKELIRWAYECGFEWVISDAYKTNFAMYKEETCYYFLQFSISFSSKKYFDNKGYDILEFSELVLEEEPKYPRHITNVDDIEIDEELKHMSAKEILEFMFEHYNDGLFKEIFGDDYSFVELIDRFEPEEIIEKIEEYKAKPKTEVEWLYRIFDHYKEIIFYFKKEENAIKYCESSIVNHIGTQDYIKYVKVCLAKGTVVVEDDK
jgi:hypothetical protein